MIDDIFVGGRCAELFEKGVQFEDVFPFEERVHKDSHVDKSFFAQNEHGDPVVGLDLIKLLDVRGDEFKDEHDVISFEQIFFFILRKIFFFLPLLGDLLENLLHIRRLPD